MRTIRAAERQVVAPDLALCAPCEAELFDPANRRYRYPFITCADCGPRFTIIDAMPYARERTSMRAFLQCPACRRECDTPGDRRYHSQTNSCAICGPKLWLDPVDRGIRGGSRISGALQSAADLLLFGRVVALRGLGGFQVAVDATNDAAVSRLRTRQHRPAKPFTVVVRTLAETHGLATVSAAEAALLASRERPIVLLRKRSAVRLAPSVAPGIDQIGVMLAHTPLQHLLCELVQRPLVMTGGNLGDEPAAISNDDAKIRLAPIADAFLLHDREIVARCDDSVLRVVHGAPVFLRRGRAWAPLPLRLPIESSRPLLAMGPRRRNTFTLVNGADAYVSQHIGDLDNLATLHYWRVTLAVYQRLFHLEATVAVRDLHPGYMPTPLADDLGLEQAIAVQHHHAHIAAVLAEHGVTDRVVGVAFDGAGYGDDDNVWGAEFLIADLAGYQRAAQLRYAPMAGGDLAAREPWRAALGYATLDPAAPLIGKALTSVRPEVERVARQQITQQLDAPLTSSMGRLFDAAAAILGVCAVTSYDGQAALELEALAGNQTAQPLPFPMVRGSNGWILDPIPLLAALAERRDRGVDVAELAAAFHESVAAAADSLAARIAADAGLGIVALGGGCFQNARLLATLQARLEARGLRVLVPRQLSPNDGAVSYGQAAVAAAQIEWR